MHKLALVPLALALGITIAPVRAYGAEARDFCSDPTPEQVTNKALMEECRQLAHQKAEYLKRMTDHMHKQLEALKKKSNPSY